MYLLKSYLTKSQMSLFGHDHHIAYTRTNKNGTVSQIKQKGSPRPDHDFSPRGNVGENIDIGSRSHNYDFLDDPESSWGIGGTTWHARNKYGTEHATPGRKVVCHNLAHLFSQTITILIDDWRTKPLQ
jgi:hypothetical protein